MLYVTSSREQALHYCRCHAVHEPEIQERDASVFWAYDKAKGSGVGWRWGFGAEV